MERSDLRGCLSIWAIVVDRDISTGKTLNKYRIKQRVSKIDILLNKQGYATKVSCISTPDLLIRRVHQPKMPTFAELKEQLCLPQHDLSWEAREKRRQSRTHRQSPSNYYPLLPTGRLTPPTDPLTPPSTPCNTPPPPTLFYSTSPPQILDLPIVSSMLDMEGDDKILTLHKKCEALRGQLDGLRVLIVGLVGLLFWLLTWILD